MPKIKQLSSHEAQKIAAGEVVERPANIVKELIENSIDAGATRINIYLEDGGKQLIRVVDDGCGMDSIDAQKCFDRHATSKITHVDELEFIDTFGFRGEALASIASISKITLLTKEEHARQGTQIYLEPNMHAIVKDAACATGTDIAISDLFFNVPARKKFLKTTQTEWRAIQLLFNAFCFDYPHIHFSLFSENNQIHNFPAVSDLKKRALQIFEPASHKHLTEISVSTDISITGIVSDHQQYRYDRSSIYLFVNKRWIKNQHLSSALLKGYANVIPQGRYPLAVIHITIASSEVDINIHPRKEEVKFSHPRRVEQLLQNTIKECLEKNISKHITRASNNTFHHPTHFNPFNFDAFFNHTQTPSHSSASLNQLTPPEISHTFNAAEENISTNKADTSSFYTNSFNIIQSSAESGTNISNHAPANFRLEPLHDTSAMVEPSTSIQINNFSSENYRLIGQYKNTYLLIEKEDGLFLIDQHAAHERILYEIFSQRLHEIATVQLLFPHIITLDMQDIETVLPHLDIFINHGIHIEQCAQDQLLIQSLPIHLKNESIIDLIKEIIASIIENRTLEQDLFKKTINNKLQAQMACKAAVKAGDILTQEKMEQLLLDLHKTANRFSCPHGRPTGWLLSLSEIERKFKRRL